MEATLRLPSKIRFLYLYEAFIWFLYASIYKYTFYLTVARPPVTRKNCPQPQLISYAICATLYVIPFYRWLGPLLLRRKKRVLFILSAIVYFGVMGKLGGWLTSALFYKISTATAYHSFYTDQYFHYTHGLTRINWRDLGLAATDIIAFLSVSCMWYVFENEQKKHLLEKDNLVMQLQSLKSQLHPHFLFNTLNSIYGMSLAGNKETPAFILRLSNMMRYILYDCRQHMVAIEKDMQFLTSYIEMEKKRYPESDIQFTMEGVPNNQLIAPLLFIPFIENSLKHGSHRMLKNGFVNGRLEVHDTWCHFHIHNDFLTISQKGGLYGGIGIETIQQRLLLYYPDKHQLHISNDGEVFEVQLTIFF